MTFLVPFFAALLVGATGITRQAWRDEHATWWAATIPMPDLMDLLGRMDMVLAPYYLFMRAWIFVFGDSVVAMRVPSLLAMATAAGLTGLVGARLFDPWVGVVAGSLLAVVPSISRYAEEARPYSFALCFAVASILVLVSRLAGARRWILLAVMVTLTGFAHLIALTVLFAHLPFVLRSGAVAGSASSTQAGATGLASAARSEVTGPASTMREGATGRPSTTPAGATGRPSTTPAGATRQPSTRAAVSAAARVRRLVVTRWTVAVGAGLLPVVPLILVGARQAGQVNWIDSSWKEVAVLPTSLARSAAVAGILAALALLGVIASSFDRKLAALLVWALAPPVAIFIFAPQFFYYRYMLFTLPAWTLLAALGAQSAVRALSRRRQEVAAIALCVTVLVLGARDHRGVRSSPLAGDQDYQGAAAYLSGHMNEGDAVLFDGYPDRRERFGFAYELRRNRAPAMCENLATCTTRVWLVTNRGTETPPGFTVLDTQRFPGIELRLLSKG